MDDDFTRALMQVLGLVFVGIPLIVVGVLVPPVGFFSCGVLATTIVLLARSHLRERREFAEQQRRDDAWDREHGIGGYHRDDRA